jgi:hypothetical protein
MTFYIEQNGQSIGPVSIDDIPKYKIYSDTLVWEEGALNWIKASESNYFKPFIIALPPPLPNSKEDRMQKKYDLNVPKEMKLIQTGIILMIISLVIVFLILNNVDIITKGQQDDNYNTPLKSDQSVS